MKRGTQTGFTLAETVVSLFVMSIAMVMVAGILISSSRLNKTQQLAAETQVSVRNTLSMIVNTIRDGGWDPAGAGIAPVALDPDPSDPVDTLEVFADLNADGDTDDAGEAVLIRYTGGQIDWRQSSDPTAPFVTLAVDITNDADGDGTREAMFIPDTTPDPKMITVRITAESPLPDPKTGLPIRYTLTSDVALRSAL